MLSKREWWGLWSLESTFLGWAIRFQMESNKATLGFACGWPVYIMASFPWGHQLSCHNARSVKGPSFSSSAIPRQRAQYQLHDLD